MKPKILAKISRRFEGLPLHHIDTSVILESESTEDGRYCRRYLHLVGNKYRGAIPFPVMSEFLLAICELASTKDRYDLLDVFTDLISAKKIVFYAPKNIGGLLIKIRNLDKRIGPTDREIVACGIEHGCDAIVTLDKDLIYNEKLENKLGIKIRHPKELL